MNVKKERILTNFLRIWSPASKLRPFEAEKIVNVQQ
jgi:hypothetical protein